MKRVKALVDPDGLLNPGVIINPDPRAHLADLKTLPAVEDEVDKCIECGYCEPRCPSRDLTLTPRQRIVVRREMARLRRDGRRRGGPLGRAREPSSLRGARHVRRGRPVRDRLPGRDRHGPADQALPRDSGIPPAAPRAARLTVGRHFALVERGVRAGARDGPRPVASVGAGADDGDHARGAAPRRRRRSPSGCRRCRAPAQPAPSGDRPRRTPPAVYFPSCLSRTMGALPGRAGGTVRCWRRWSRSRRGPAAAS